VLLDVTARNPDRQPQVFSEGRLINVSESHERSFSTPVSMLADEFLTLQVLQPSASVRGKIAYEVPDHLPGVLYWAPGTGRQRILLHLDAPAVATTSPPTTSANAEGELSDVSPSSDDNNISRPDTAAPAEIATRPSPEVVAMPSKREPQPEESREGHAQSQASSPAAGRRVASITPPASSPTALGRNEAARMQASQALVSRNDPAEKDRYRDFFSRECAGYAMPSAWGADPVAEIPAPNVAEVEPPEVPVDAPRWPPRPGPAFNCAQAYTRAEHLICADAVLSLMDWELNRAYAQASRVVDDPAGLQRDEDSWRHRVRDGCATAHCVETVYDQRTAQLQALADRQR
jgi:hypothetical protein